MLEVARRHRQLDFGLGDRDVHPLAVMLDGDDVHALLGAQLQQLVQLARPVGDARADDEVAPRDREPVTHDRDEQRRVDVAAGEHDRDGAGTADLAREQRGDADRAGTLDDELRPLEQQHDRLADLLVGHVDHVVEQRVEDAHRQLAGLLHEDAVRDREARLAGLHADDAHVRLHRAQRGGDPGREPAAADRDEDGLGRLELLRQLEADRALAGDHDRILERMEERRAGLPGVRLRRVERLFERLSGLLELCAVVAARVDLRHRRVERHVDARAHSGLARGPGNRLAVVAGARRHDACGALLRVERRDPVDGAADLEGARPLEVLALQPHLAAGQARQRLRAVDRGDPRDAGDAPARLFYVTKRRRRSCRQFETPSP